MQVAMRRLAGPAVATCVLLILALTLTRLGVGASDTPLGICVFGLPCWLGHFVTFAALGFALAAWFATSAARALGRGRTGQAATQERR